MNIVEKINLQNQLGGLVLFREGIFLRGYNESCYLLATKYRQSLKIQYRQYKCLPEQIIVMSGFPERYLAERLPQAEITDFGAHLPQAIGSDDYINWLARYYHANNVSVDRFPREKGVSPHCG